MQTHHIDGETGFLFVSEMINCTCLTVTPGSEYKKDGGRRLLLFFVQLQESGYILHQNYAILKQ